MTPQLPSVRFLLVLITLLVTQGQEEPDPKVQGLPWETELLVVGVSRASPAFCSQGCLGAKPEHKWLVHQLVCTALCCSEDGVNLESLPQSLPRQHTANCWDRLCLLIPEDEMCQRPWWDPGLRLAPDQENYKKDEEVTLSCIDGFQPSFTIVKCAREVQSISLGKPVYREVWRGRNSRGAWIPIRSRVECVEVFQVVPGTLEISSTSIKLNWTCRLPDACQHMWARCRLAEPSSPPCEAEEVKGEEMLHGQEGTFTCPPLQPFTVYSVTISLPPSTILFSWLVRTKETVPDKPEKLWLDASTGSLRWKALPSCKGEILGYQLNITARSSQDRSFLEVERLRLNGSITQHRLPEHSPGSSCVVTVQGLTAAGAGAALLQELQTNSSGKVRRVPVSSGWPQPAPWPRQLCDPGPVASGQLGGSWSLRSWALPPALPGAAPAPRTAPALCPLVLIPGSSPPDTAHSPDIHCRSVRDISPSQGTAVLPLRPIAHPAEAAREHQLVVATTHNSTVVEGACVGEPGPNNASWQPHIYMAAVLNLTNSTAFVLGDGARGQDYHNAALQPGSDYTALLRLVRHSQQAEKFTCVCYSFSFGQPPGSWHGTVVGVVVLLVLLLLAAGILLYMLSRKRNSSPSKAKENN
ncbi:uncharacterized protein O9250_014417 [Rhynochetos jubatus]